MTVTPATTSRPSNRAAHRRTTGIAGAIAALALAAGLGACGSNGATGASSAGAVRSGTTVEAPTTTAVEAGAVAASPPDRPAPESLETTEDAAASDPSTTTSTTVAPGSGPTSVARMGNLLRRVDGLDGRRQDLQVSGSSTSAKVTGGATGSGPADDEECEARATQIELLQDMAADAYREDRRTDVVQLVDAAEGLEDIATDRGCFFIWG